MSEPTPEPTTEPTPQPEPTPKPSWVSDDGTLNRDAFGDDLGQHSIFDKYPNIEELVKGSISSQKMIGQKAEDFMFSDDPDLVAKRNELLGVPKEASEYEYEQGELPDSIPVEMVNERINAAKEKFKELGIPKEAAKALLEWDQSNMIESLAQQQEAQQAAIEQATKELQSEWKGEKYDDNLEKAKNALEFLGLDWAEDPSIGNNPKMIKDIYDKIVPVISNDAIIEAKQTLDTKTLTEQYDAQFDRMYNMDRSDPAYDRELRKMEEITRKMEKNT